MLASLFWNLTSVAEVATTFMQAGTASVLPVGTTITHLAVGPKVSKSIAVEGLSSRKQ
jgi:hypothetical protein